MQIRKVWMAQSSERQALRESAARNILTVFAKPLNQESRERHTGMPENQGINRNGMFTSILDEVVPSAKYNLVAPQTPSTS